MAFTNSYNLLIDYAPLLKAEYTTAPLIQLLVQSLPLEVLCSFHHNPLSVTLFRSWRWFHWAIAWKLYPHHPSADSQ